MILFLAVMGFGIPLIYLISANKKAKQGQARELELIQRKIALKEKQAAEAQNSQNEASKENE